MTDAMLVKAYDAIRYSKPLIVAEGSYVSKFFAPYKVSYAINVENDSIGDDIYRWYKGLSKKELAKLYSDLYG